jgi:cytoskeleton protein RodZ
MFGSMRKQPEQHDPAEALVREVGAHLRQARIARGEELEQVAENLRIRPSYLHGLEQGDLSVMPGRTYALGFLRSYAQYLGFDGDDLIAQIRSSVGGLTSGAHLHGRTPLAESRLPKLPILVISLAALAGVYAGWAYVDDRSRVEIELVADVPDDLQQQATAPPPERVHAPPAVLDVSRPPVAAPDVTPAMAPATEPSPPIEPQAGTTDPQTPPGAHAEATAASAIDPSPAQDQTASEVATGEAGEDEAPDAGVSPLTAEPPAEAEPATLAEPEPPAADVLAALAPVADGAAPTIYRTGDAASRVMLRARTSAWVHVSSTNNDYLWVKTLRPGDAFVVPDRPDLVLWTGNAGGVEVIVDGAPLPPLGPEARVVRDVSLQPQALLRRLLPAPAADAAAEPASR